MHYDVTIHLCPLERAMWLTDSEMHTLPKRVRNSWIGRYFYRPEKWTQPIEEGSKRRRRVSWR